MPERFSLKLLSKLFTLFYQTEKRALHVILHGTGIVISNVIVMHQILCQKVNADRLNGYTQTKYRPVLSERKLLQ